MGDKQAHVPNLLRNAVWLVDDHALRRLRAQICKFLQHFLCGAEIERRLNVRILKALGGHKDGAVNGVLRVHKVHVARGHHRNAEAIAQGHNPAV